MNKLIKNMRHMRVYSSKNSPSKAATKKYSYLSVSSLKRNLKHANDIGGIFQKTSLNTPASPIIK